MNTPPPSTEDGGVFVLAPWVGTKPGQGVIRIPEGTRPSPACLFTPTSRQR